MAPRKPKAENYLRGIFEKPEGSKIFWIRYVDGSGRYKREKVGRRGDAITLLSRRKADAAMGVKMPDNLRNKGVTFAELAEAILVYAEARHSQVKDVTIRVKRILPTFGPMLADKIRPEQIDEWLVKNTLTPATANRYKSTFSLIFREAIRNGRASSNPARLVRHRAENNSSIRFLSDDEQSSLTNAILKRFPKHLPELTISLGTGMRLSEQYLLTWSQVDFQRREVRLSKTKNGSRRTIPMNASVLRAFDEMRKVAADKSAAGNVFPIRDPKDWFKPALSDAKIIGYRWHDNRHTFCSRLAMKGLNIKVIQELAGHKTIAMSARYAHLNDETLRAAVAVLG